jgi:hypothetical protein
MPSQFHSQPQPRPRLPILLLLLLLLVAAATEHHQLLMMVAGAEQPQPITLAGCPDKCGDTSIPFPFGMTPGCFRPGFLVVCDHSFLPPRAFLDYNGGATYQQLNYTNTVRRGGTDHGSRDKTDNRVIELIDVSLARSEARIRATVSSRCSVNATSFVVKSETTYLGNGQWPVPPIRDSQRPHRRGLECGGCYAYPAHVEHGLHGLRPLMHLGDDGQ